MNSEAFPKLKKSILYDVNTCYTVLFQNLHSIKNWIEFLRVKWPQLILQHPDTNVLFWFAIITSNGLSINFAIPVLSFKILPSSLFTTKICMRAIWSFFASASLTSLIVSIPLNKTPKRYDIVCKCRQVG